MSREHRNNPERYYPDAPTMPELPPLTVPQVSEVLRDWAAGLRRQEGLGARIELGRGAISIIDVAVAALERLAALEEKCTLLGISWEKAEKELAECRDRPWQDLPDL